MGSRRTDSAQTSLARFVRRAGRPVDIAWLAAFRIFFGAILCVSMIRFLVYGWVERLFVEPTFHFKYWGFAWVEALPGPWMHALFVAMGGLALCVALGLWFRVAAIGLALGLSYVQLIDVSTYLNHYYLAALLVWLLACTPANRAWSIDARRARRQGRAEPPTVAAGVLWLLRFQVATVYMGAALAKAQPDWLLHGQPLRIWLGANTELPVLGPLLTVPGAALAMSWAGFLFDLTIPLWLCWSRTRPFAYGVVLVFHTLTRVLFPIGMFPFIMSSAALMFFSPSWPRTALAWLRDRLPSWRGATGVAALARRPHLEGAPAAPAPRTRLLVVLGVGYCLLQVALPLRHLAYGGNVLWHEQGMRFSWRVMVRAKGGHVEFEVRDRETGELKGVVHPRVYLTDMQQWEMSSQPDLILQLAHHIERDVSTRDEGPVAVRAVSRVSLNGRRSAPLVDPDVDLTTIRDGLARADWILPAPDGPPPHTRPVP